MATWSDSEKLGEHSLILGLKVCDFASTEIGGPSGEKGVMMHDLDGEDKSMINSAHCCGLHCHLVSLL